MALQQDLPSAIERKRGPPPNLDYFPQRQSRGQRSRERERDYTVPVRIMKRVVAGLIVKEGKLQLNLQDEIIRETMITRGGEIVNARVREFYKLPPVVPAGG